MSRGGGEQILRRGDADTSVEIEVEWRYSETRRRRVKGYRECQGFGDAAQTPSRCQRSILDVAQRTLHYPLDPTDVRSDGHSEMYSRVVVHVHRSRD